MPPINTAVGDLWQVTFKMRLEQQLCENVMDFSTRGPDADVDTHLVQVAIQCFISTLISQLPTALTLEAVHWKRTSPTLSVEQITTTGLPRSGDIAGDTLPSYCSVVFSKHTALGGRTKHGRLYMPGVPEAATIGSKIDTAHALWAAYLAWVQCVVNNFINPPAQGGSNFVLGVYSRKTGGSHFPYGAAGFTPCTQLTVSPLLGTTRSRKLGRGD